MPNLLDLPQEILECHFSHLIISSIHPSIPVFRSPFEARELGCLRLVCRAWADWIYVHHLYRTKRFGSAWRSLAFLEHLKSRSAILPRAKCQCILVINLWPFRPPPPDPPVPLPDDAMTMEILDKLLELFSDTILMLGLDMLQAFTLPRETIQAIARIPNLCDLHLDVQELYDDQGSTDSDDSTGSSISMELINPACFHSLIMQLQGLNSLDLAVRFSVPCVYHNLGACYPAITHLNVNVDHVGSDLFLAISIALKPSLKFLVFDECVGDNVGDLLPVYETLRETLEGLQVPNDECLAPLLHLSFPKLRVFAIWESLNFDFLRQAFFAQSPIEVIAIVPSGRTALDTFRLDTLSNLTRLKKVVVLYTQPDYKPPPICLNACEAQSVTLRGKLAQLLPVDMQSREHHLSRTQSTLGWTVTVHDAQSLRTTSETRVKLECSARQLAAEFFP
ncbi:hypothetical protein PCANC_11445 [Puccinia coronata f. sp. avenae]|uniref:F-box domain-containing protein n=1 Tax=Puccinia coronata f. sp. avenae TaxID=200324 RepID=A0A2N5VCN1_9BASI|nr:hypothetical protein PCANC_11445 [Puccinia coronata f. sp. avenae]